MKREERVEEYGLEFKETATDADGGLRPILLVNGLYLFDPKTSGTPPESESAPRFYRPEVRPIKLRPLFGAAIRARG